MSIDLYCGPLVRYYTDNWKTPSQQFAEQNGIPYEKVYSGGQPTWLTPAQADDAVRAFRRRLEPKLNCLGETDWVESQDRPYLGVQIRRKGFEALMIWAAYVERPELERPLTLPADYQQLLAVAEAVDRG